MTSLFSKAGCMSITNTNAKTQTNMQIKSIHKNINAAYFNCYIHASVTREKKNNSVSYKQICNVIPKQMCVSVWVCIAAFLLWTDNEVTLLRWMFISLLWYRCRILVASVSSCCYTRCWCLIEFKCNKISVFNSNTLPIVEF